MMEGKSWLNVHSEALGVESESFWRAIDIWWLKPHTINRRLSAAVEEHRMIGTSPGTSAESLAEGSSVERSAYHWLMCLLRELKLKEGASTSANDMDSNNQTGYDGPYAILTNHLLILKRSKYWISSEKPLSAEIEIEADVFKEARNKKDINIKKESDLNKSQAQVICVRLLLPRSRKNVDYPLREIAILDHQRCEATFVLLDVDLDFPTYKFSLHDKRMSLLADVNYVSPKGSSCIPCLDWLRNTLLRKLIKWASEKGPQTKVEVKSLVPMDRYTKLYSEMKQKYGAKFVEIWPENTDPKKFVYEDVAIATYLILLFEDERKKTGEEKKQSFVDLGCGNGLLVHILNSEGYPGKGIDLRRRKIWGLYGHETNLEESTIIASMETSFKDCDWLIGNHSDELTPWMPVMATRSSYATRYFVLPCCFHDFDCKFSDRVKGESHYRTYLNFVRDVGEMCGFEVEEDKMRIPSTKKVCHVGRRKTYPVEEHPRILKAIEEGVASRCRKSAKHDRKSNDQDAPAASEASGRLSSQEIADGCGHVAEEESEKNLAPGFKPRPVEERVKNCSRVEWSLKERIQMEVAMAILKDGEVKPMDGGDGEVEEETDENERSRKEPKLWRRGGSIGLGDVAKMFDGPTLKRLKSECGGLKTLLKNLHPVFEIAGNTVSLRDWSQTQPASSASSKPLSRQQLEKKERDRQLVYKTRLCWFDQHHPDGCPRVSEACPYAHGQAELRSRPIFGKASLV